MSVSKEIVNYGDLQISSSYAAFFYQFDRTNLFRALEYVMHLLLDILYPKTIYTYSYNQIIFIARVNIKWLHFKSTRNWRVFILTFLNSSLKVC